ncbi:MAG: site-specific DNA-methyltransferase [Eubacteriales bacterium]|nr:site-specific DNA-methyltransferase [Eubacteriales bacterium]MDD4630256.1 site-specific DNA-methyltransferase [Eubacteriales bacterium]
MARKKKSIIIDTTGMRDIEAYTHEDKKRTNNPPVGMAQHDTAPETRKTYDFDPHIDPTLDWAGKKEGLSFDVPTSSIHIHESIKPHKIIRSVQSIGDDYDDPQISLFETPVERMRRRRDAIEFYQHGVDWTNRLIAGDSLVIMNSLLEKEGMAGQVQMIYIDPPYGIKYGSNFQPFVDKRDVKDKKDEDLTQEPEMIKAFRDTWELGIHSYLTYLRNRLLLARELLADSGSVFVQISDENVHHVREICDEVFGVKNFICLISVEKTSGTSSNFLSTVNDYIVWYGKTKDIKYRQLLKEKELGKEGATQYVWVEINGEDRRLTKEEIVMPSLLPQSAKIFAADNCTSMGKASSEQPFEYLGKTFYPSSNAHWKPVYPEGMSELAKRGRLKAIGNSLMYKRFLNDFPVVPMSNIWNDTKMTGFTESKIYVVQTSIEAIKRCLLMTTDPGDLVLDITCGSGTTAFVAEQWGRRWITCDTSRVAIALAKKRLMTATYDYYKLADEAMGIEKPRVSNGFVYKTVPHITLKSIANNEPPATETLYDQPEVDKKRVRISGPFTVEALPAPVVKPLDETYEMPEDYTAKQTDWRDEMLATGILGRGGAKIEFSRVEPLSGTIYLQAEAETKEDTPRRAVICFADETKPMDSRMVALALTEAEDLRPTPKLIIFAAFQFDPEAAKDIDSTNWGGVTCLKVQMNTDLMTEDLKKKRSSNQSFWLIGQPDVELIQIEKGKDKGKYKVKVNGFDYYDVKKGTVESGNSGRIAMWMLDTNYDGMSIEPMQVFFPIGGKKDGWARLAKTLKAEIDQDLIEQYAGTESLPFVIDGGAMVAVKIIDDRGIESLKVLKVGV